MKPNRLILLASSIFIVVFFLIFPAQAQEDGGDFTVGSLLIDTSHDSFWTAEEIEADFSKFIAYMEDRNFTVTVDSDWANLADYSIVLVMLSQEPYSYADVDIAREYLDSGGAMLVMGEWFEWFPANENINGLLTGLGVGVQIQDALVEDDTFHYDDNPFQILITDFTDHCLNEGRTEILYTAAAPLVVDNEASILYSSSFFSYLMESPDTQGPFPMAAVADPDVHPDWHLIVTGETSHLTDYSFEYGDNESLVDVTCDDTDDEEDPDFDGADELVPVKGGDYSGGCSC